WATLLWDAFEAVALIVICVLLSYLLPPGVAVGQNILWYAALLVVLRFAYQVMEWWVERLVVTDKRFILTHGVFTTEVLMMPVTKVTDLTYQRPFWGRVFGYGTVIVSPRGRYRR